MISTSLLMSSRAPRHVCSTKRREWAPKRDELTMERNVNGRGFVESDYYLEGHSAQ